MTYYRLLRNNKESGPFSEEEMMAKGFKPYDLIWVEGKSAGWRYPSEIPAFKSVAPAIEEQPYDRFYKKQPPQKLFGLEETPPSPAYNRSAEREQNNNAQPAQRLPITGIPAYERPSTSIPRHIHVTLPSGNTVNLTALVAKKEPGIQRERPASTLNPGAVASAGADATAEQAIRPAERTIANNDYPSYKPLYKTANVAPETAAHLPADDTASYAASNPATAAAPPVAIHIKSNPKTASSVSWTLLAAAFIGVATFVGLGIMIGLSISRDKHDLAFNEALRAREKAMVATPGSSITKPPVTLPETPLSATENNNASSAAPAKELVQNAVVKSTVLPEPVANTKDDKKALEKSTEDKTAVSPLKDQPAHTKPVAPVNVEKSLSLTANDFKTGAFGGITNLKYTLTNASRYPLEMVEVEIEYIQANNKVYKTARLVFKDVPAGAQTTLDAPSSNRGVKMNSKIIKVNTRETLSNTTAKS